MNKDEISRQLKTLASSDDKRPKAARLRDVFDDVELALQSGVTRALVVETLKANGLSMTLKSFDSAVARIRAKRRHGLQPARRTSEFAQLATGIESTSVSEQLHQEHDAGQVSHNPAALDAIIANKPDLSALAKLAKSKRKSP